MEAPVGADAMDRGYGGAFHVEVHPVSGPIRIPGDGLLLGHRERRCGDIEAKHGPHSPPRVPEHHYLVAVDQGFSRFAFR